MAEDLTCATPGEVSSGGLYYQHLSEFFGFAPLPTVCLQIILLSLAPYLIHHTVLSRFHQPLLVSQILAGMIGSKWAGGHQFLKREGREFPMGVTDFIFPKGFQAVDMIAHFSSMFFIFKVGVQMDPKTLKAAGWRTFVIGVCCCVSPYAVGQPFSVMLKNDHIEELKTNNRLEGFRNSIKIVDLFSLVSFPVIAYVLTDLNILNSDLGHLALHVALVSDFGHMNEKFTTLLMLLYHKGRPMHALTVLLVLLGTVIYIFFIVRPAALRVVKNTPEGRPVKDVYISLIFVSVLLCGLASEFCGMNGTVGAFFLGLAIPDGPPLGSALVEKLQMVSVFFMPLHMGIVGLKTDIYDISYEYGWRIVLVIIVCIFGKIIGVFFPAMLLGIPARDSLLLGLIMNLKGIVEVSTLNTWLDANIEKGISTAAGTVMVFAVVVVAAIITPIVKHLYNPSTKYTTYKGRSILQSNKTKSDLRVLACVHIQDDVPAVIRLLEASNPTKHHPLTVYVLHLVELIGRASPLLIAHPLHKRASTSNPTKTERIVNTFQQFQNRSKNLVTVHPFSTISPYASMHNDICSMAADNKAAFIIFPFFRKDAVSLSEDPARQNISNRSIKTLLQNLLRNSPCSLGILIDNNNNNNQAQSATCFLPDMPYRVIVLFFGGPDDREALAFAMNMIHHPSIFVTVIRFYATASSSFNTVTKKYSGASINIDTASQKLLDDELVDSFKIHTMQDESLIYKEVEVKDGIQLIWALRPLHNYFDVMLVGRKQVIDSSITTGFDTDWSSECEELGVIGDIVSAPDYDAGGAILIVRQQEDIQ